MTTPIIKNDDDDDGDDDDDDDVDDDNDDDMQVEELQRQIALICEMWHTSRFYHPNLFNKIRISKSSKSIQQLFKFPNYPNLFNNPNSLKFPKSFNERGKIQLLKWHTSRF